MKKYIDILEDIKTALAVISSNAHNGLQSTKRGSSMKAYYDGKLAVVDLIGFIIRNGEQEGEKDEN